MPDHTPKVLKLAYWAFSDGPFQGYLNPKPGIVTDHQFSSPSNPKFFRKKEKKRRRNGRSEKKVLKKNYRKLIGKEFFPSKVGVEGEGISIVNFNLLLENFSLFDSERDKEKDEIEENGKKDIEIENGSERRTEKETREFKTTIKKEKGEIMWGRNENKRGEEKTKEREKNE